MQFKVINSNSQGNAYILETTSEALLIEAGVNFDKVKIALRFNLAKVVGCIVTHEHGDHAKSVANVMKCGIGVWATSGTLKAIGCITHHRANIVEAGKAYRIGGFTIKPYEIKHDCAEPVGFLIHHAECGTVLFMTDTKYCEYRFDGMNHIIIEANYAQDIIDRKVEEGGPKFLRDRVLDSHMSLSTCIQTLKSYDLSKVVNIVLIHLSDGNSDSARFKKEVQQATGKLVNVAEPGLMVEFKSTPF
jgi:phosphoribosyl 1,2-cyclic phosphodiesterase